MNNKRIKQAKAGFKAISTGAQFGGAILDLWTEVQNHPAWYTQFVETSLINANFGEREALEHPPRMNVPWGKQGSATHPINAADAGQSLYVTHPGAQPQPHSVVPDAVIDLWIHAPILGNVLEPSTQTDPLREAATILLNQLRSVATTTVGYTVEDFMRYLNACQIATAWYATIRRTLGCIDVSDAYDADAPVKYAMMSLPAGTTVPAETASIDDIRAGVPYVKSMLSTVTGVLRTFLPMNVTLLERTKWLFANVFKDSPSAKFSSKIFRPTVMTYRDHEGVLHVYTNENLSILNRNNEYRDVPTGYNNIIKHSFNTFADYMTGFRQFLDLIAQDDMTSRIVGDLLKAFGDKIFMPIPDYVGGRVPFAYDEDILNQIQNATPVFHDRGNNTSIIVGKTADLVPGPTSTFDDTIGHLQIQKNALWADGDAEYQLSPFSTGAFVEDGHLINTFRDSVSPGRVLALTRLTSYYTPAPVNHTTGVVNSGMMILPAVTGTEHVISYRYAYAKNGNNFLYLANDVSYWSADDYAPMMWFNRDPSRSGWEWGQEVYDRQNWASIPKVALNNYHSIAALSMYTIPFLVSKQTEFRFAN